MTSRGERTVPSGVRHVLVLQWRVWRVDLDDNPKYFVTFRADPTPDLRPGYRDLVLDSLDVDVRRHLHRPLDLQLTMARGTRLSVLLDRDVVKYFLFEDRLDLPFDAHKLL